MLQKAYISIFIHFKDIYWVPTVYQELSQYAYVVSREAKN